MKKDITVVYYAYLYGRYKLLIQDQLEKVMLSGLYEECKSLNMYICGPEKEGHEWVLKITKPFEKINVIYFEVDKTNLVNYREGKIVLKMVSEMAESQPGYYAFFHTKSLTNYDYYKELWRKSSDWQTICEWKKCTEMLDSGYDAVGPNYRQDTYVGFFPCFAGGYWWATSEHLTKLNMSYLEDTTNHLLEEFWIGSNPEGKYGSVWECGHEAPYLIESSIDTYIKIQ
jgi:hypothetical protein